MERGRRLQYVVTIAVLLLTTAMGIFNAWQPVMTGKIWVQRGPIHLDSVAFDKISLMTLIGYYTGAVFAGICCDVFGRRTTILFSAIIFEVGTIFAATAIKLWMLCAMEFLWQFACGTVTITAGIYLAEIADPEIRGMLLVATKFTVFLGRTLILSIKEEVAYDKMNYWLLIVAPLAFVACYPIPESPYYHLRNNNEEEARKAFARLRQNVGTETIQTQFDRLKSHTDKELEDSKWFVKCLINKRYTKAIIASFGMELIFIMSGIITIHNYYYTIAEESDVTLPLNWVFVLYVTIPCIIGIVSAILVDRVGRRALYLTSFYWFGLTHLLRAIKESGGNAGIFCAYGTVAAIGFVFTYYCLPETKNKSLGEVQEMLQGKKYLNNMELTNIL
ncbi:unnamed protein product [Leptosia nina]|uniref:Major facilitator superfamily (MFS) profile domain-containing protein n=1 Tax=Leptosia nina TaxID=320188 RepID=A0AAV1JCK8_9NEOP